MVQLANDSGWHIPENLDDVELNIAFEDWDQNIIWDEASQPRQLVKSRARNGTGVFPFQNADVESGDWTRSIIWSDRAPYKDFTKLQLSLNDPAGPASLEERPPPPEAKSIIIRQAGKFDPFNLSNDKLYEVRREQKKTVRQTFGHLEVQHTYPAMKLQFPWVRGLASRLTVIDPAW